MATVDFACGMSGYERVANYWGMLTCMPHADRVRHVADAIGCGEDEVMRAVGEMGLSLQWGSYDHMQFGLTTNHAEVYARCTLQDKASPS